VAYPATDLGAGIDGHRCTACAQPYPAGEKGPRILGSGTGHCRIATAATETTSADLAELEDIGLAYEEVASLGEKQAEAGQVDLAAVDFRSREIGIQGKGSIQLRCQFVENIQLWLEILFGEAHRAIDT